MARAVKEHDPFRRFRFCPRIGIDGNHLGGIQAAEVLPGVPWQGSGQVVLTAVLLPDTIEFLKISDEIDMPVDLFTNSDDFGTGGKASGSILLSGIVPAKAQIKITKLDATESGIVSVFAVMDYDRLTFVFGDNVLDKLLAVI